MRLDSCLTACWNPSALQAWYYLKEVPPEAKVGEHTEEALTECDESSQVQDLIRGQVVKL